MIHPDTRLFLIEDNDLDAELVERMLVKLALGVPIVRARNGEEALEILRQPTEGQELSPPFVILLDLNMPKMNGLELLEHLDGNDQLTDVPIFILTTSSLEKDINATQIHNVSGYLAKPITAPELMNVLQAVDDNVSCKGG